MATLLPALGQDGGQLGVHPGYKLINLRPAGFEPQVTGMGFLPDGRLAVSTIALVDGSPIVRKGAVYILSGIQLNDSSKVSYRKFADNLADPLGLKVLDGTVYVAEHNQITALEDKDGDGTAEVKRSVLSGWNFTGPDHEFAFGPAFKDGLFYAAISVSIINGGHSRVPQAAMRGCVIRGGPGARTEILAGGLRNPNGLGAGPDGELFATDNQGDWLPSSKLVHVKTGRFFGHASTPFADQPVSPPVAWLPHGEAGRSPTVPVLFPSGPFAGQILFGDVALGGLTRVFTEKVGGEYQGCVFLFGGGFEAGLDAIAFGPDGALYVGGLGDGDVNNWGWLGKRFGLQKLQPQGAPAFEMKAVRAMPAGLEIEFTEPAAADAGAPAHFQVEQWRYQATADYGGPKVDLRKVIPTAVRLSSDRTKAALDLPGLQAGYVVHLRLSGVNSAQGPALWSPEAWYTFNRPGPADVPVALAGGPALEPHAVRKRDILARALYSGPGSAAFDAAGRRGETHVSQP